MWPGIGGNWEPYHQPWGSKTNATQIDTSLDQTHVGTSSAIRFRSLMNPVHSDLISSFLTILLVSF